MVLSSKLLVAWSKRFQNPSFRVVNVQVGSQVVALEVGDGVKELALGSIGFVEFMVPGAYEVDALLFGNLVGEFAAGLGRVVDGVAFDAISCIDE